MASIPFTDLPLVLYTSNLLEPGGDEYVAIKDDPIGQLKVDSLGYLQGGREYKIRTFTLPHRGDKLFVLATECARSLQYRDSYSLFYMNPSLFKIIASAEEKEDLIAREILPYGYGSRQIAVITARSVFRHFGFHVVKNGQRIHDDYRVSPQIPRPVDSDQDKYFLVQQNKLDEWQKEQKKRQQNGRTEQSERGSLPPEASREPPLDYQDANPFAYLDIRGHLPIIDVKNRSSTQAASTDIAEQQGSPHSPIHRSVSPQLSLRSDGIRKQNERFVIPKERNLQTIDALILASTDENEKKELKEQKRLLRNRQAALDSRQRKKAQTNKVEQESLASPKPTGVKGGNYEMGIDPILQNTVPGSTKVISANQDTPMLDIDWSKWDNLFPVEMHNGKLDLPEPRYLGATTYPPDIKDINWFNLDSSGRQAESRRQSGTIFSEKLMDGNQANQEHWTTGRTFGDRDMVSLVTDGSDELSSATPIQQVQVRSVPTRIPHSDSNPGVGPWTAEMDEVLIEHGRRLKWDQISERFFGNTKTANACRKRHARLMFEAKESARWDQTRTQDVISAYETEYDNGIRTRAASDALEALEIGLTREKQSWELKEFPDQKLLACPFAKFDSLRYGPHNTVDKLYQECASSKFRDIARVKSHLKRVHYQTDLCCPRCLDWFPSRIELDRHTQKPGACPVVEIMSQDKVDIKQQPKVQERKWYDLYRIIFPTQELPQNPYCESLAASYGPALGTHQYDCEAQVVPPSLALHRSNSELQIRHQTSNVISELRDHHQPHDNTGVERSQNFAATDSGYASMHPNKQAHTAVTEDMPWETETAYTAASVETTRKDGMMHTFAVQLFGDIGGRKFDKSEAATLSRDLPALLADFALRLGQRCSNPELRKAMVFIHRYRSVLSESLKPLVMANSEEEEPPEQKRSEDEMSMEEKMRMWQSNLEHQDQIEPQVEAIEAIEDYVHLEESEGIQEFDKYAEIVLEDCAYAWLLGKLRNQALLTDVEEHGVMSSIRHEVLHVLPKTTDLRSRRAPTFQVVFEVLWPLRSFLIDDFADADRVDIGRIITITGKALDAQALTCGQYMDQTWPHTGIHLLRLLQQLMRSHSSVKTYLQRPDGAILEAVEANASTMYVTVIGTSGVAAEVAEQLSWLSAALRKVPESKRYLIATPSINCAMTPVNQHILNLGKKQRTEQQNKVREDHNLSKLEKFLGVRGEPYHFQIKTVLQDMDFVSTQGLCWHQMVRKSIMVRGFPIRRRQQGDLGLEISLKVAAELVGTKYVNSFAGQLFVKGYSTMLVPTLQIGDVLVWHLSVSPPGQHLSYHHRNAALLQDIKIEDIDKYRHVVGWCSHALNYAGAADGHYTVRRARFPKAFAGCALADKVISFSVPLTSDVPFVLAKRNYTTYAQRSGYLNWFRYLSQKFVLFWDKRDQKGWLLNGISALLHLVRASLSVDERNSVGSDFVLKPSDLKEPRQPHSAKAPREFLSQRDNLRAKISLTKVGTASARDNPDHGHDEYEILDDRMEQYCHVLEKAITYSEKLQDSSAGTMKGKLAFRLEGWDFVDLVEKAEPVDACITTLSNESHSWLELVRSAGVATFFGQGFGELIRPSASSCCNGWKTLPAGKSYIAANVSDVKRIMELKGDPDSKPRYLTETLMWHHPAAAFENCGCKEPGGINTKLVQQPCSTRKICVCPELHDSDFEMDEHEAGAVIFGYNPEYGPLPDVENDEESEDSGLGSSLTGTRSRSSSSIQQTQRDSIVRQYGDGNVSGGNAHFGDTIHYTYNYAMPPSSVQQSTGPTQPLGNFYQNAGESTGSKRCYSDTQMAFPPLQESQSEHTSTDSDPGPSKRAKMTKGLSPCWQDIMLA